MILRRLLLASLVALTALICFGEELKPLPPYKLRPLLYDVREVYPQGNCPAENVGGWWLEASIKPAVKVYWAVISDGDMRRYCPGLWACAETRGEVGFIFALMPPEMYPPWLLLHEWCHTQGWMHPQWNQFHHIPVTR